MTVSAQSGSLADAYKVIAAKEFVDLSHSFSPVTPVWGGFGQATMAAASDPKTHEPIHDREARVPVTFYPMVGQYGTHIDPPAHFDADGKTMDQIPLKQMILPPAVHRRNAVLLEAAGARAHRRRH